MAYLAYRDKTADDATFSRLLPMIARKPMMNGNFVESRELGFAEHREKKNVRLNRAPFAKRKRFALKIRARHDGLRRTPLRELKSDAVQARLRRKGK